MEISITPIDIGFDLRKPPLYWVVNFSNDIKSVKYLSRQGKELVASGTPEDIIYELNIHGYKAQFT